MSAPVELSLVVPVYNERESLRILVDEIGRALAGRRYEIVAVDDGSSDGSLDELKPLKHDRPELHIVALAANAGQTAAFAAGFRVARGRVVVTLDADLQNDPADIPGLVAELPESGPAGGGGAREERRPGGRGLPRGPARQRLEAAAESHRQRGAEPAESGDHPQHRLLAE